MTASTTVSITTALRLAAQVEGVTARQLSEATGLGRTGAWRLLRRLTAAGALTADERPARKGRTRGDWARVWRTR